MIVGLSTEAGLSGWRIGASRMNGPGSATGSGSRSASTDAGKTKGMALAQTERGLARTTIGPLAATAACSTVLIASLLLGGGTRPGFLADAALQLISVPILLLIIHRWNSYQTGDPGVGGVRAAIAIIVGLVLLHLIQLIPLPPEIWTRLPGRTPLVKSFEVSGQQPGWLPISVSSASTWLALMSLVPSIAVFLGTVQLDHAGRRVLVVIVIAFAAFSAALGLLQVASGPQSSLRPFAFTNNTEAVGLFANRNHLAALLYCALLLVVPWGAAAADQVASTWKDRVVSTRPAMVALASFTIVIMLVAGQAMARSRAGIGLMVIAVVAAMLLTMSGRRQGAGHGGAGLPRLMLAAVAIGVLFAGQFALYRTLERFETDSLADSRVSFLVNTLEAARAFLPFGSGIGTFVPVYAMFEKFEDIGPRFTNRAHNDIAELTLEAGILGVLLLIAFGYWLVRRSSDVWSANATAGLQRIDVQIARAASIAVLLLLAHSLVDYPLRTAAMAAVLAVLCGLLLPPPVQSLCEPAPLPSARRQQKQRKPRSRTSTAAPAPAPTFAAGVQPAMYTDAPHGHPVTPPSFVEAPPNATAQAAWPAPGKEPPSQPAQASRDERWGDDVAWPEAWRNPSPSSSGQAQPPGQSPGPSAVPKGTSTGEQQ